MSLQQSPWSVFWDSERCTACEGRGSIYAFEHEVCLYDGEIPRCSCGALWDNVTDSCSQSSRPTDCALCTACRGRGKFPTELVAEYGVMPSSRRVFRAQNGTKLMDLIAYSDLQLHTRDAMGLALQIQDVERSR